MRVQKENKNLYVNAGELLDLIECMYQATDSYPQMTAFNAVQDLILDLQWVEIERTNK